MEIQNNIILLLTAIFYSSFLSANNQIILYAEEHYSCFNMRKQLSKEANQGDLFLLSENAFFSDSMHQINLNEIDKKNKEFLGYDKNKNIWGLEDYFAKNTSTALAYLQKGDDLYKQYESSKKEELLASVNINVKIGIDQITELPYYVSKESKISDYFSYPYYLQKTLPDQENYIKVAVLPFSIEIQDILLLEINKLSKDYNIKSPIEIEDKELNYLKSFHQLYPKYSNGFDNMAAKTAIIWRNYFMVQHLIQMLNDGELLNKPIAVILGAAHVLHFEYLLKNIFHNEFKKFTVTSSFTCWEKYYNKL